MAKLYPPNINGTIPAFCNDNGTVLITVPFSMNKAVSKSEVGGFALKIKTVSGVVKGAIKTTNSSTSSYNMEDDYYATFDASFLDFSVGQYYKFQLAYIGKDGIVGYYSTVGVDLNSVELIHIIIFIQVYIVKKVEILQRNYIVVDLDYMTMKKMLFKILEK